MGFSELTTSISGNANQYSKRTGDIDRIIVHHCASTSLSGVLAMMSSGSREVSANYVIGNGGEIVGVVPEESRAWTSSSASWDGRAITFEIVNETGAPDWRISDAAFSAVAKMLADISRRYGIELSRATVVTHQELYNIHGASYATACPGPYLQSRIDQLIAVAMSDEPVKKVDPDMPRILNLRTTLDGKTNENKAYFDGGPGVGIKHIANPGHFNLLARFIENRDGDHMFPSEFAIINTYLAPQAQVISPATVEDAVRKAIAAVGVTVDAAAVAGAVEEALKDDFAAIPAATAVKLGEKLAKQ